MSKPSYFTDEVWDKAEEYFEDYISYKEDTYRPAVHIIAHVIAEERAGNEGICYWKGAYERMAARNAELERQLEELRK